MAKWFVFEDDKVTGPHTTDELKALAAENQVSEKALIWGRLQAEWKPVRWWMVELPNLLTHSQEAPDSRLWHYAHEGSSHGPFLRDELISRLKDIELNQDLLIWTKGMKSWAPIFEFNDILDEIGVNKRQFPRADIDGKVIVKFNNQSCEGQLVAISEGGFGATGLINVSIGQVYSIELVSDSFYDSLYAKAEVRYLTETGYAGFKFQNINMESRGAIIQYVKSAGRTILKAA